QLRPLAAFVPGEEDEAALVEALQQHHADGRAAVDGGGRERRRLRRAHARRPGLLEPGGELPERIGIDVGLVEGTLARIRAHASVRWRKGSRLETPNPTR